MLRFIKNYKKSAIFTFSNLTFSALCYADYKQKINLEKFFYPISKDLSGQIRSIRTSITVGKIVLDYKFNGINETTHEKSADSLLYLCTLNKGTYIKVGQHVGALEIILPTPYVQKMKKLYSEAPESTFDQVMEVLSEDLNTKNPIGSIFKSFEEKPIGSASLAQVHKAVLIENDQPVAVKVQHKLVYESALRDVKIMDIGFKLADYVFPDFKLMWLVELTKSNLFKELDFRIEYDNSLKAQKVYKQFTDKWLIIPKCYKEYQSRRILVMNFEEGHHIDKIPNIPEYKNKLTSIIKNLQTLYSEMMFNKGFIHCDPHPGNILIREDKIILLDHGLYAQVDDDFTFNLSELWYGLITGDTNNVIKRAKFFNIFGTAKSNPDFEMHEIFASMMMNKDFRATMEEEGLQTLDSKIDRDKDQSDLAEKAYYWMNDISEVLQAIPPELVLIFKTNDLIRSLEYQFNCRANCNTYLHMSKVILKKIRQYKRNEIYDYFKVSFCLFALYCYTLKLKIFGDNKPKHVSKLQHHKIDSY